MEKIENSTHHLKNMDQTKEEKKIKQIRFSIGSYNESSQKVIKKITKNGLFSSSDYVPVRKLITSTESFKTMHREKPATLEKYESTKYNTLPNRFRTKHSSVPLKENISHNNCENNLLTFTDIEKPTCESPLNNNCHTVVNANDPIKKKPSFTSKYNNGSILPGSDLKQTGKVALIVTAYEGEPKTPTRLEFLPQTRLSRSNSKTSSDASNLDNVEISSKLQNELVATLKRSNLRTKNDILENGKSDLLKNNEQTSIDGCTEKNEFLNVNVKKLTAVLDEKITFRIKSEHNGEITDKK